MIKQIFELDSVFNYLTENYYAYKLISHFKAYGTKYNFCRFYIVELNEKTEAIICIFNSSMVVATVKGFYCTDAFIEDIITFINMNSPNSIEMDSSISKKFIPIIEKEYSRIERTYFEFVEGNFDRNIIVNENPNLDTVFPILAEGFEEIKNNYELWLTDTSHRVRHGLSKVFLLENHTTATMYFQENGVAFLGNISTSPNYRGKNYARTLLYYLYNNFKKQDIKAYLFAKENRKSFYEQIGFKSILTDIILERKSIDV